MLDAELNSASDGTKIEGGHRPKSRGLSPNTEILPSSTYCWLLTFAHRPVLWFKLGVLDAELNSTSNGIKIKGGHRAKSRGLGPNTEILDGSN